MDIATGADASATSRLPSRQAVKVSQQCSVYRVHGAPEICMVGFEEPKALSVLSCWN